MELYWKKGFAQAITPLISLWQTNYLNSVNKTKLLSFTLPPKQLILLNPRQQLDLYPWYFHTQAFSFYKWQAKWVSTSHRGLSTSILEAHTEFNSILSLMGSCAVLLVCLLPNCHSSVGWMLLSSLLTDDWQNFGGTVLHFFLTQFLTRWSSVHLISWKISYRYFQKGKGVSLYCCSLLQLTWSTLFKSFPTVLKFK